MLPQTRGMFGIMRPLRIAMTGVALPVGAAGAAGWGRACTPEDFATAVNGAGAALRKLNAENAPRLQTKMRQLKTKMGWPDAGYEEKAYEVLQDERVAAFDAGANDLLARIDTLGTVDAAASPTVPSFTSSRRPISSCRQPSRPSRPTFCRSSTRWWAKPRPRPSQSPKARRSSAHPCPSPRPRRQSSLLPPAAPRPSLPARGRRRWPS